MAKTRFFCIAVEGATTDGRIIERAQIEQMAAGYNPATYTARINCEHLRGFSPDAPFNAYGSVTALETRDVELQLDGKTQKRLGLFGQLDANDQLVTLNKKGQKLFTSIEMAPNFAATGKAGLVGLAVTDSPASLGTEILAFAAGQSDANPFAGRKQDKANLFSAAAEAAIVIEEDSSGLLAGIKSAIADGFAAFTSKKPEPKPEPKPEDAPANDNFAAFAVAVGDQITAAVTLMNQAHNVALGALRADLDALTTQLATTEKPNGFSRQAAPGGSGRILADY